MTADPLRAWLEQLEQALEAGETEPWAPLALLAGRAVDFDAGELHAARRRAMLLLAAGGDPMRALQPDARAVTGLAADLDGDGPRAQLQLGLEEIAALAEGLTRVRSALEELQSDAARAWLWLACGLLADELAGE